MPEQEFHQEMSRIDNWVAELRSLGGDAKNKNELNGEKELHDMTDRIKHSMYQEYKKASTHRRRPCFSLAFPFSA